MAKKPKKKSPGAKKPGLSVSNTKGKGKSKVRTIEAPEISYNEQKIKELRSKVRNAKGQFYPREYYQKLAEEIKTERKSVNDFLVDYSLKNGGVNVILERESHQMFFNGIDTLEGATKLRTVTITDFKGNEFKFTADKKNEAIELMRELNRTINNACDAIERNMKIPKGRKASFPIQIKEGSKTSSKNGSDYYFNYQQYKAQGTSDLIFTRALLNELDFE